MKLTQKQLRSIIKEAIQHRPVGSPEPILGEASPFKVQDAAGLMEGDDELMQASYELSLKLAQFTVALLKKEHLVNPKDEDVVDEVHFEADMMMRTAMGDFIELACKEFNSYHLANSDGEFADGTTDTDEEG